MKKQKETRTVFKTKCPKCKKEIKGTSESQVDWNLKVHMMRKHNQKIKKGSLSSQSSK